MTAEDLANLMAPKPLDYYRKLTPTDGAPIQITPTQDEMAVALKIHDHGFRVLSRAELRIAYNLIFKLKTEIFP